MEHRAEFRVGSYRVIAIIQSNGPLSLQTLTRIELYLHRMVSVVYSGARKQLLIEQRLQTILLTSTSCVCNNAPCRVSLSRHIPGMKPNTNEASGSHIHSLTQRMKCITFRNQGKEKETVTYTAPSHLTESSSIAIAEGRSEATCGQAMFTDSHEAPHNGSRKLKQGLRRNT